MGLLYDYHVLLIFGFVKVTRGYVERFGNFPLWSAVPY